MTRNAPVQPIKKPAIKADISKYRKGSIVYRAIVAPSPSQAPKYPKPK